jgi:hypothetical protein
MTLRVLFVYRLETLRPIHRPASPFMTPVMLRQLWSLIETTQATLLVNLDDATLVQWLLKQLKTNSALNGKETDLLNEYIESRLSLIRDLAEQRLAPERF